MKISKLKFVEIPGWDKSPHPGYFVVDTSRGLRYGVVLRVDKRKWLAVPYVEGGNPSWSSLRKESLSDYFSTRSLAGGHVALEGHLGGGFPK